MQLNYKEFAKQVALADGDNAEEAEKFSEDTVKEFELGHELVERITREELEKLLYEYGNGCMMFGMGKTTKSVGEQLEMPFLKIFEYIEYLEAKTSK